MSGPTRSRRRKRCSRTAASPSPTASACAPGPRSTDHVTINDRRTLDGLSPYYIWTPDYAEKRLSWKRRHPLHVLLLRVHRIPRPVTVRVRDEYHGCRSWVEIDRDLPFEGTPVMADEEFDRARAEIREVCGAATEPVAASEPSCSRSLVSPPMSWIETESLIFTARHDTDDSAFAERTLDRMEDLRLRLEDRFEQVPGEVTVVVHTNPAWLTAGPPLPARRPLVGGAGRAPLPRRLGDGDRAARAQRPPHGTPRRRRRLAARRCAAPPSASTRSW